VTYDAKEQPVTSHKRKKKQGQKIKYMMRGAKDYNKDRSCKSDDTTSTYICRHFGMEKKDKCMHTRLH
jgi:hypothetical protein